MNQSSKSIDVELCDPARHEVAKQIEESPDLGAWKNGEAGVANDFAILEEFWIPQLKSHCGVASAVICLNSLKGEVELTQDSLFNEETDSIIKQEVVYEVGLTLEELENLIRLRTNLEVKRVYTRTEEGSVERFRQALRKNRGDENARLIVNFSRASIKGEGEGKGHFSPVWDYDEANDRVLILEVKDDWNHYWVSVPDMYTAMCAIDPVCGLQRGWVEVWKA